MINTSKRDIFSCVSTCFKLNVIVSALTNCIRTDGDSNGTRHVNKYTYFITLIFINYQHWYVSALLIVCKSSQNFLLKTWQKRIESNLLFFSFPAHCKILHAMYKFILSILFLFLFLKFYYYFIIIIIHIHTRVCVSCLFLPLSTLFFVDSHIWVEAPFILNSTFIFIYQSEYLRYLLKKKMCTPARFEPVSPFAGEILIRS